MEFTIQTPVNFSEVQRSKVDLVLVMFRELKSFFLLKKIYEEFFLVKFGPVPVKSNRVTETIPILCLTCKNKMFRNTHKRSE